MANLPSLEGLTLPELRALLAKVQATYQQAIEEKSVELDQARDTLPSQLEKLEKLTEAHKKSQGDMDSLQGIANYPPEELESFSGIAMVNLATVTAEVARTVIKIGKLVQEPQA